MKRALLAITVSCFLVVGSFFMVIVPQGWAQGARCGNGIVDRGEQCEPPGSLCSAIQVCNDNCRCEPVGCRPFCGNDIVEPGEQCDPPGSLCSAIQVCNDNCRCEPVGG